MAIVDILQKIGLDEKEAKIYLASLELGEATIQQIARKAGVTRPSTYLQIESLTKKGLMSFAPRGKKKLFSAEPPESLNIILKTAEREVKEKADTLNSFLPQLKELYKLAKIHPQVRFYEGSEGGKARREEIFKSKEKFIRNITPLDELFIHSPQHTEDVTSRRVEKGIRSRVIYTYSKGIYPNASNPKFLREMRLIPKEKFPFSGDIVMTDDLVALASLRGKFMGVLIRSQEIADAMKVVFDLAWEAAKKYDEEKHKK